MTVVIAGEDCDLICTVSDAGETEIVNVMGNGVAVGVGVGGNSEHTTPIKFKPDGSLANVIELTIDSPALPDIHFAIAAALVLYIAF
ncbi:MAG: hypothetical protein ACXWNV_18980 [Vulcanimicrobiaceae bacterium]